MIAAVTPRRASRTASTPRRHAGAPNASAWSSRPAGTRRTAATVSAITIGSASSVWARITAWIV